MKHVKGFAAIGEATHACGEVLNHNITCIQTHLQRAGLNTIMTSAHTGDSSKVLQAPKYAIRHVVVIGHILLRIIIDCIIFRPVSLI